MRSVAVSITSVRPENPRLHIQWPTRERVELAVEADKKGMRPLVPPLFFWNDHSRETPHPEVVYSRKLRELSVQACVGKAIERWSNKKIDHYHRVGQPVQAFILSAGGGVGFGANEFIRDLTLHSGSELRDQSAFHRGFMATLSTLMLKHNYVMASFSMMHRRVGGLEVVV